MLFRATNIAHANPNEITARLTNRSQVLCGRSEHDRLVACFSDNQGLSVNKPGHSGKNVQIPTGLTAVRAGSCPFQSSRPKGLFNEYEPRAIQSRYMLIVRMNRGAP